MQLNFKPRRVLAKVLLLIGGLVVAFLFSEIGLRIAGISYPLPTQRDPYCGYSFRPGAEWIHTTEGRSHISINRFGFRDVDWQIAKPQNTTRLAVIGDSFVAAFEMETERRFTSILQRELQTRKVFGGQEVEVLNFGQSGYGTAQELMILRHKVWQFQPDIVVLAVFTANDICNNSRALNHEPLFPYFDLHGGQLVLDQSFADYVQPLGVRLVKHGAEYLRTAQLAYHAKHVRKALQARTRERSAAGIEAALLELGFKDPTSARMIYAPPIDAAWKAAWDVTEALLVEFNREVESRGARFFLVTLSNDIQVHPDRSVRERFIGLIEGENILYPDERICAFAVAHGIPVLTLAPKLQRFAEERQRFLHGFENTRLGWGHWNEEGHAVAGQLISEWLADVTESPDE
jgi:hypothetical protein